MPPVSVATLTVSKARRLPRLAAEPRSSSDRSSPGSTLVIFTKALLLHPEITPRFFPAMPPVMLFPVMLPPALQSRMVPVTLLSPTSPPTLLPPVTVPVKEQFSTVPLLTPTIPPAISRAPLGETLPRTSRFFTTAPGWRVPNRPMGDRLPDRVSPERVWPPPSKVPPKLGMGVSSTSARDMSPVRTTLSLDQESRTQPRASSRSSSAVPI